MKDNKARIGAVVDSNNFTGTKPEAVWFAQTIVPPKYRPMVKLTNASASVARVTVTFVGHCRQPNG